MSSEITQFLSYIKKKSSELVNILKKHGYCLLVTHYDADGISSGAIFSRILQWLDCSFHIRVIEQIDEDFLSWISDKTSYQCIVFLDMGSPCKSLILEYLSDKSVIIVDHHVIDEEENIEASNVLEINPRFFNIDGSSMVSASGLCYFIAKSINEEKAIKLAPIALLGALGDRQDKGKHFSMIGLNQIIVRDGIKHGLIIEDLGLRLFGLRNRPLVKCLEYTFDPYLPELSGDENACFNFLKNIGINPVKDGELRYFKSLTREEISKLATELVKHIITHGYSAQDAEKIFGKNYFLPFEDEESPLYDAREFAMILNACGRMNKAHLGILLAMGIRDKILEEAMKEVDNYRKILSTTIRELEKSFNKVVKEYSHITVLDLKNKVNTRVVPAIASLISSSRKWGIKKPLVVLSESDEIIKISIRKPYTIAEVYEKINLAEIMKEVSKEFKGSGGGHESAAGGTFLKSDKDEVIRAINRIIGRLIGL